MTVVERSSAADRSTIPVGPWVVGIFFIAILIVYHETTGSMVAIWSRSETFAHGFLILPISLWLVWSQRGSIARDNPQPVWWVVLLMLPLGSGWLLAWLIDVTVLQQLAMIAMIVTGTWAIIGHRLGRQLLFPLFFLFFAVPVGEGLITPMMEYTATSTVWLIELTGIPVYREGLNFALPSGRWSVVEACSGVRYIIASVTVGTLYAYLTYRSWYRRIIFVVISAIVPILANSARAYIIVILGHLSGMTIATGADHLVYGWLFFGLMIFLLFWLGSYFREDNPEAPPDQKSTVDAAAGHDPPAPARAVIAVACSSVLAASVAPLLASTVFDSSVSQVSRSIQLPAPQGNWIRARDAGWEWRPPARLASQVSGYFELGGGAVGVYVQYADGSMEEAEVIGSSTLFALEESGYLVVRQEKVAIRLPHGITLVDEAQVRGWGSEVLAWSWYTLGDISTSDKYEAKFRELSASLGFADTGGSYRIVVTTPVRNSLVETRSLLQDFLDEHASLLYHELHRILGASH